MLVNTNLYNFVTNASNANSKAKPGGSSTQFARVVDIILDEQHPDYLPRGGAKAINGIFFRPLNSAISENDSRTLPFAYQGASQIKTVPVVGEIVQIETMPTSRKGTAKNQNSSYYTRIVNIWNHPNTNVYLDVFGNPDLDITQSGTFNQNPTISPLRSAPGDLQIEGRQGQSLRFTGAKGSANPWVDDSNIDKPLIILSNGQIQTEDGFTTINEDINEDSSSIYIASDHKIPLTQASEKRDTYNVNPTKADQFKGNQVIINSGRLFFNAKENDIQLSSQTSIGLNTNGTINLDATGYLCIDGDQIYLGSSARTAPQSTKQPVLLGNQTELFLELLIDELQNLSVALSSVSQTNVTPLIIAGNSMRATLQALSDRINPNGPSQLKSKKVYTE